MHRNDCPRAWRDDAARRFNVQAIGIRINIGEDRYATGKQYCCRGAIPGVCRNDHFVAKADSSGLERHDQSDGSVRDAAAVLRSVICSEFLPEFAGELVGEWISA